MRVIAHIFLGYRPTEEQGQRLRQAAAGLSRHPDQVLVYDDEDVEGGLIAEFAIVPAPQAELMETVPRVITAALPEILGLSLRFRD